MKKYAEYKDSGIAWIGEIPKDWEVKKIKYFIKVKDGTHDTPEYVEEGKNSVPLITSKDIKHGRISFKETKHISKKDYELINMRSDVMKFDVIMPMIGTVGNPAIVLSDEIFSIKNVALFKTGNITNAKFLQYYLDSPLTSYQFDLLNRGGVQPFVSLDILKNIYIIMNNDIEKLITYLDCKTTAIDTLIADKQMLIDLLKEKRQVIISEAVTKGLDKNVKMKDSGIEWIGGIPEDWEVKPFRNCFHTKTGISITRAELLDEGIDCIGYGMIHSKYGFDLDLGRDYLKKAPIDCLITKSSSLVIENDFVFCDTSEDISGSGNNVYVKELAEKHLIAGSHTILAHPISTFNSRFVAYLFSTSQWRAQIQSKVFGVKVYSITQRILKDTALILPPIELQETIINYLDTQTEQIDSLISDITTQIDKLKEYRQSIISEAVTGKVMIASGQQEKTKTVEANLPFKRRVLAARILDKLCDEPTMGHVKLEKLLFLSEYCAKLGLETQYNRHAAGPYSPTVLRSIDSQLKKANWFEYNAKSTKSNKYSRLQKSDEYVSYITRYFDEYQLGIVSKLIGFFKTERTIKCEIVATLYGAWNDFLIDGTNPNDEQIVNEVLNNWHENKEKVSKDRWLRALAWMKVNNLIPDGYGASTKGGRG